MSTAAGSAAGGTLHRPWGGTVVITAIAIAVYALLRWLPLAGDSLHYTDFGVGERGFLEFCEPGSPQFAPVDRVASPVTLTLEPAEPVRAGEPVLVRARLTTASGKPVTDEDLLVVHTRKLHLLIVDATLEDYQHEHPEAAGEGDAFAFTFTPRRAGRYRVFADFMPRATGRSLYAGATLEVAAPAGAPTVVAAAPETTEQLESHVSGIRFRLSSDTWPLRLNQTANLVLTVAREDGSPPELEEIMGAPAHVVAFDAACSGFAHLHPAPPSPALAARTEAGRRLAFTVNLPNPGYYRLWAQVQVDGREIFAPFGLRVVP